jgi:hypothetical protein
MASEPLTLISRRALTPFQQKAIGKVLAETPA